MQKQRLRHCLDIQSLEPLILMSASSIDDDGLDDAADLPLTILGTDDSDWIAASNSIAGVDAQGGNDSIYAPLGDTLVDGGGGEDTLVIYSGLRAHYSIERLDSGDVMVVGPGLNGQTVAVTLKNVERIEFNDGVFGVDELLQNGPQVARDTTTVEGTDESEWIGGSEDDNTIYGFGGDDEIHADLGTNDIDGGDGTDTLLVYGGFRDEYTISELTDGRFQLEGPGMDDRGVFNRLVNVEQILFDDELVILSAPTDSTASSFDVADSTNGADSVPVDTDSPDSADAAPNVEDIDTTDDTTSPDHSSHDGSDVTSHDVSGVEVPAGDLVPAVSVTGVFANGTAIDVLLDVENFVLTPEGSAEELVLSEGHLHVYVDGERIGRFYDTIVSLEGLTPGEHLIKVVATANNHAEFLLNGETIAATVLIDVPEESDAQTEPETDSAEEESSTNNEDNTQSEDDSDSADDGTVVHDHSVEGTFFINTTDATSHDVVGQNTDLVEDALVNFTSVVTDETSVYATTSGIPFQVIGPFPGNPGTVSDQDRTHIIPIDPVEETGEKSATSLGSTGVWVDGVAIYNWSDARSYNNEGVWNQNAVFFEGDGLDENGGHPPPGGEYHTHAVNIGLMTDLGDDGNDHSPILGWSYDGFPIYGPWGYENADGSGEVVKLDSSWQLRDITERTHLADGTDVSDGPTLVEAALGAYVEDYEYIPGLGDLDEYNGVFSVTPEYPDGIYHYVVTIDDTETISIDSAVFPYVIGLDYYGVVEEDNIMAGGGGPGPPDGGGPPDGAGPPA